MAEEFDCNCPQYVDFLAGLSGEGDSFFGEASISGIPLNSENRTPHKSFDLFKEDGQFYAKSESAKQKGHQFFSKSTTASLETPSFLVVQPLRRRSRSESAIQHKYAEFGFRVPSTHRSSSVNDLRPRKKRICATTPMCLKRTLVKSKAKKPKSSEEIELEKIAELQKQLSDHLRFNERTLWKLKIKPKSTIPKFVSLVQESNPKETKKKNGKIPYTEALNTVTANLRSNFKKDGVGKPQTLFDGQMNILGQTMKTSVKVKEIKNPPIKNKHWEFREKACSSKMAAEKEAKIPLKRPLSVRYGFHSGLPLVPNPKRTLIVKPFFLDKEKGIKDNKTGINELQLSNSMVTPQTKNTGKENNVMSKLTSHSEAKITKKNEKMHANHSGLASLSKCIGKSQMNVLKERNLK